jgi:GT2 family glycosyltransferase
MGIERPIIHDDPDVSVVIPTVPANSHERVVGDLREQSYDAFEVLVVNRSDLSVCEARNHGIEESTGSIVAFTDDDCRPPTDWVKSIIDGFENNDVVIVEGPVDGGMEYSGTRKYPTCNVAVRREVARSVGGFRTEYEYWREDTEFGWRVEEYGDAVFSEKIHMNHPGHSRSEIKQRNEQLLNEDYPEKYNDIIIPDSTLGRLNFILWQKGFWSLIDKIRYE